VRAVSANPAGGNHPSDVEVVEATCPALRARRLGVRTSALFVHPRAVWHGRRPIFCTSRRARGAAGRWAYREHVDDPLTTIRRDSTAIGNKEVEEAIATSSYVGECASGAFAIKISMVWASQIRRSIRRAGPYGSFAEAVIHEHDLAPYAAALCDHNPWLAIPLTGSAALTYRRG